MSFTESLYLIFFTSGFTVGFGHCIGMCGPIVASLSLNLRGRRIIFPHLLYNAGRITTYVILGGLMGAAGSFTRVATSITSIQKGAMIFAGILIVVMGLAMAGWIPFGRIFGESKRAGGLIARAFRKLSSTGSNVAFYPLGLFLGLLPCGPVYTALVASARAGMEVNPPGSGILSGMGIMLAFGLGTVPALLLVARLAGLGWLKKRELIYRIGAILMILVGFYFVIKGILY
jgi:sulfite exporter TauE/SafE